MLRLSDLKISLLNTGASLGGPAMALDFSSGALDPRITFSRGTNATLVDSTGRITYAPNNLLTYSEDFSNAAWTKTAATITADATTAPDGTTSADKLVENTATTTHFLTSPSLLFAANTRYVVSIYVKAAERSWVALQYDSGPFGTSPTAYFNVGAGVLGSAFNGAIATMVGVGDGWYRCSIAATTTTSTTGNARLYLATGDNAASYTGVAGSGAFAWGAQLEAVTYQTTPGTYNATTVSAYYGPRFDYDPVTLAPKGLLIEEQRTNLATYSSDFTNAIWFSGGATIAANAIAAPDGTLTADSITATAVGPYVFQGVTVSAGANTVSIYVKGSANTIGKTATAWLWFSGTATGPNTPVPITLTANWQRITAPVTATGGGTAYLRFDSNNTSTVGDVIYVWGAQAEAGSFATSYIPTVASTVSRSADVASMTGTNFSSWYNQAEGTFVAAFDMAGGSAALSSNRAVLVAREGATSNQMIYNGSGQITGWTTISGVDQAFLTTGALAADTVTNAAYAYKANDFAASRNGGSAVTDTSGSLPVPTAFGIGSNAASSLFLSGHIRAIAYYNTRLPNTQLQTLTAPSLASPLALDFISPTYTVGY
jgi:hypothetical protein